MIKIVSVLLVTALVGLAFSATRAIGLLGLAVLALLYPIPVLGLILFGGGVWLYLWKRPRQPSFRLPIRRR